MHKIIKKLTLLGFMAAAGFMIALPASVNAQALVPVGVFADAKADVCEGVGSTTGATGCATTGKSLNDILKLAINILTFIAGFAAVVMIIIAGLRYITGGGEASSVASAKNALIYAVVGLVIVALAQVIVRFVLAKTQ